MLAGRFHQQNEECPESHHWILFSLFLRINRCPVKKIDKVAVLGLFIGINIKR